MKTILKLLIVAALMNAAVRTGQAYWEHYQLEDQAQQLVLFGWRQSPEQLHNEILDFAARTGVPLDSEQLLVERDGVLTSASATYSRPIQVIPGYYYAAHLTFNVEGRNVTAVPMTTTKTKSR